jgi:hypothetical protein
MLRLQHHVLAAWVESLALHMAAQDGDDSPMQANRVVTIARPKA